MDRNEDRKHYQGTYRRQAGHSDNLMGWQARETLLEGQ
jgi:hypothetical protein